MSIITTNPTQQLAVLDDVPPVKAVPIKRMLTPGAAALAAAGSALAIWLAGSGTALAPEPARLRDALSGSNGNAAAAYYFDSTTNTTTDTSVVKWPGTWAVGSSAAGTPCSTTDLAADSTTYKVIQRSGSYAKCV